MHAPLACPTCRPAAHIVSKSSLFLREPAWAAGDPCQTLYYRVLAAPGSFWEKRRNLEKRREHPEKHLRSPRENPFLCCKHKTWSTWEEHHDLNCGASRRRKRRARQSISAAPPLATNLPSASVQTSCTRTLRRQPLPGSPWGARPPHHSLPTPPSALGRPPSIAKRSAGTGQAEQSVARRSTTADKRPRGG